MRFLFRPEKLDLICVVFLTCAPQEYYDGGDLLEHLREYGPMEDDLAATLFLQVASAVKHIHDRGYIHRDIKVPSSLLAFWQATIYTAGLTSHQLENVLLSETDTQTHLADFGFAGPWAPGQLQVRTATIFPMYHPPFLMRSFAQNASWGSLHYAAPEIVLGADVRLPPSIRDDTR